jgi:hypothetical protein
MPDNGRRAMARDSKLVQLISQAKRARKLAAACKTPMVAELFEIHAQMCERNAQQYRRPPLRVITD